MAVVPLKAMLWRRVNQATLDTLRGESRGQYDIRLTASASVALFFQDLPSHSSTDLGGYTVDLILQPFDGDDAIPTQTLQIRYMGPDSERADWYIRAQRPDRAYPLWRIDRGFPGTYSAPRRDFILLLRDVHDGFHARAIREETFATLPGAVAELLESDGVGVKLWIE